MLFLGEVISEEPQEEEGHNTSMDQALNLSIGIKSKEIIIICFSLGGRTRDL